MAQKPMPPIPTSWPHDKRARVHQVDGLTILFHPDRTYDKRVLCEVTWTWKPLEKVAWLKPQKNYRRSSSFEL